MDNHRMLWRKRVLALRVGKLLTKGVDGGYDVSYRFQDRKRENHEYHQK